MGSFNGLAAVELHTPPETVHTWFAEDIKRIWMRRRNSSSDDDTATISDVWTLSDYFREFESISESYNNLRGYVYVTERWRQSVAGKAAILWYMLFTELNRYNIDRTRNNLHPIIQKLVTAEGNAASLVKLCVGHRPSARKIAEHLRQTVVLIKLYDLATDVKFLLAEIIREFGNGNPFRD